MKTSQVLITSISLILALSQIGCSAKITAESPQPDGGNNPQGSKLDLAQANGVWKTGCYVEVYGFASESTLELNNGNFKTTSKAYNGATCDPAQVTHSYTGQGKFVVVKESDKESGSWEIDIQTDQGNGVTVTQYDLVRLENGELYLGDVSAPQNGSYPSKVDKKKAFKK